MHACLLSFVFWLGMLLAPVRAPHAATAWDVVETRTGRTIEFTDWVSTLVEQDVIYLGEQHHTASHVEAALRLLGGLLHQDRRPTLALEMFGWDGQEALNRYLVDPAPVTDEFVRSARWEQNWGGRFEDYEPLLQLARQRHVPVVALNPPLPLVRQIARQGLSHSSSHPDMDRWGMRLEEIVDDPAYRNLISEQLRACHGGLSDEAYHRMYQASLFRDEAMAKTIVDVLRKRSADTPVAPGPLVSYTGSGHIQYGLPIPNRVRRRVGEIKQVTVYLLSSIPEQRTDSEEQRGADLADYLWLTPSTQGGPAQRCG